MYSKMTAEARAIIKDRDLRRGVVGGVASELWQLSYYKSSSNFFFFF